MLELMISLKSSDNENDRTVSIAEVDNDAAPVASIEDENADISFLLNLNLIGALITTITKKSENDIEEGLQT